MPRGARIWSTRMTARFADGPSYRRFVFSLERGLACDALQWGYVQRIIPLAKQQPREYCVNSKKHKKLT